MESCLRVTACRLKERWPVNLRFHEILVRSTSNSVLWSVCHTLNYIRTETRTPEVQSRERAQLSVQSHADILAALKKNDGASAARAMTRHID